MEKKDPIQQLVEDGRSFVRSVAIEDSLEGREVALLEGLGLGKRLTLVSDPETHAAAGGRILKALSARYALRRVALPSRPHPDEATLRRLRQAIEPGEDAVVAVGSGTINDLCKVVAAERGLPQVVFGTAPSMNGYASVNAAITVGGLKKSLKAKAPDGVFLDLGVLASAPKRLIRSGLGDSLCRPTAQADWLLAHLLLGQPYVQEPFDLLVAEEASLFSMARPLLSGDLDAMRYLARTLVLSGFGMTLSGGSYPASQGEHLLSHYVDMMAASEVPETFHGEQIGVTALAMSALQERALSRKEAPVLREDPATRERIDAHFGAELGATCWKEFAPKRLSAGRREEINERLAREWSSVRDRIRAAGVPADRLRAVLRAAEAPSTPEELGWTRDLFLRAFAHARFIRGRYTFLDFAATIGD